MKIVLTLTMTLGLMDIPIVNAKVFSESEQKNSKETTLEIEGFSFDITENEFTRTVITKNKETGEKYTAIYDKKTQMLHDEKGNYMGRGYSIIDLSTRGNLIAGPFKAYYDVNPTTVGATLGLILAVTAIVTTAGSAGLSTAALSAGIEQLVNKTGAGSAMEVFTPGASVNGYFQYSQENNFKTHKARNINRKFAIRVGRSRNYSIYSYGNGSWFDTQKP